MDEDPALVVDIGSNMCKAGFAGDDCPKFVYPAVVGRAHAHASMVGTTPKDSYIGDHAQRLTNLYGLNYPVERGIVTNWDDMEALCSHTFYNELRINPRDHPILCTEPPMNPKRNREIMCETMLESFNFMGFYVQIQAILAMYASGRGSGVMLDSGDGVTHVVPVYEGYTTRHAYQRVDLGGKDVNFYLAKLLSEKGYSFCTTSELELVRTYKENQCDVCMDYEQAMQQFRDCGDTETKYKLPDGNFVNVGSDIFKAAEALFNPFLIGSQHPGLHELVYNCIMKCDIDTRRDLCCNVILSGGNTMFPNLPKRLENELKALIPGNMRVRTVAAPERKYNVWIGGSILTSLSVFQQLWITKEEYEEYGSCIVHRKCP